MIVKDVWGEWEEKNGVKALDKPSSKWNALNRSEPTKDEQIQKIKGQLQSLDNSRDAEDLFDVLKAKGILSDSDIPTETLDRFNQKKNLRQALQNLK